MSGVGTAPELTGVLSILYLDEAHFMLSLAGEGVGSFYVCSWDEGEEAEEMQVVTGHSAAARCMR